MSLPIPSEGFPVELNLQKESENPVTTNEKYKMQNVMRYWNNQFSGLLNSKVVIMYAVKDGKIVKSMPHDILRQIMNLDLLKNLEAFNLLTNKAFAYLRFDSDRKAAIFQNNTLKIDECNIQYVGYPNQSKDIWGMIAGVPYTAVRDNINNILSQYATIEEITPTLLKFPEQRTVESAPTKFKIVLRPGMSVEAIPNFIYFGQLRAYLSVTGKMPACFNCEQTSHLSKNCQFSYCKKCKKMALPNHDCRISYADKLRIDPLNINQILLTAAKQQFPPMEDKSKTSVEKDDNLDQNAWSVYSDNDSEKTLPYNKTEDPGNELTMDDNSQLESNSEDNEQPIEMSKTSKKINSETNKKNKVRRKRKATKRQISCVINDSTSKKDNTKNETRKQMSVIMDNNSNNIHSDSSAPEHMEINERDQMSENKDGEGGGEQNELATRS